MPKTRGVLLYSGGLDSIVAARVLMEQGIELTGFFCILPFFPPDFDADTLSSSKTARDMGLQLVYHRLGRDYIELIKDPPHGYGKRMNACIDCKIHFIRKAAEYMKESGADFVATGEVVGQRPMSQMKHMLNHIARESGIEERLLRPLSARILKPTLPEQRGLVDRERLLGLSGRSRKAQMEMAARWGIEEYSSPSGGCLFTDANISRRVKDLFEHQQSPDALDLYLLTLGRHFRLSPGVKLIVSRNKQENDEMVKYLDRIEVAVEPGFQGPLAVFNGEPEARELDMACAIIARYSKAAPPGASMALLRRGRHTESLGALPPPVQADLDAIRI
jgi:hypothetical protein